MPDSIAIISPFLEGLVRLLMPHFLPTCPDPATARAKVLEALESRGGGSYAELLNAARIIAFECAALETRAEARAPGLSPAMRLRHNACANALDRSRLDNERALERRLATRLPDAPPPEAAIIHDLPDADLQAAIQQAEAHFASYVDPHATSHTIH